MKLLNAFYADGVAINRLLNINMRLLILVVLGSFVLLFLWNSERMDNFYSICLLLFTSSFVMFFVGLCFFDKPNYYYAISLIKRIEELCHQYESATNDEDIDKIISRTIKKIDIDLANAYTIGFWLCAKNYYKGKLVESYLNFFENKLIHKAIKTIDNEAKRLQKYRQKQAKQEFEENKKCTELIQNIDFWFKKAKMQIKDICVEIKKGDKQ